ncbi:hypothetical protein ACFFMN_28860 [Planobispora siamensis]|uniref:Uncharacterized protein n=1 Tax=Planobispora siamensis TaxID=936338 RepID=A0A8J3SR88_9ACTN|nr:hypothetical protein [Planobispora siamensis]GIH97422.1 hypothetical protein Psi01_80520 [Planobispora siamensis]
MRGDDEQLLGGLISAHHLACMQAIPALVAGYAGLAGFTDTVLYVADLQRRVPVPVPLPAQHDAGGRPLQRIRIDATMAGRAFRGLPIVQARPTDQIGRCEEAGAVSALSGHGPRRRWLPLLDGTPAPETLRRLIQTLLEHQHDHLDDDATVLLVEWQSQHHRQLLP